MAKIIYNGKNGKLEIVMDRNEKMPLIVIVKGSGSMATYHKGFHFDKFINAINDIEKAIHINTLGTPY